MGFADRAPCCIFSDSIDLMTRQWPVPWRYGVLEMNEKKLRGFVSLEPEKKRTAWAESSDLMRCFLGEIVEIVFCWPFSNMDLKVRLSFQEDHWCFPQKNLGALVWTRKGEAASSKGREVSWKLKSGLGMSCPHGNPPFCWDPPGVQPWAIVVSTCEKLGAVWGFFWFDWVSAGEFDHLTIFTFLFKKRVLCKNWTKEQHKDDQCPNQSLWNYNKSCYIYSQWLDFEQGLQPGSVQGQLLQHRNLETDRLKRFVKISLLCWVRSPKPIITPILKHDDFGRPYP